MPNFIDITGVRFGRLVVLERHFPKNVSRMTYWLLRCDCGNTHVTQGSNLRSGRVTSCGCLHPRHGQSRRESMTGAYRTWRAMIARCENLNHVSYRYYGGRGISVCERWKQFANFFADMGERPPGMWIDRINNDVNYEPGNCRWQTPSDQGKNRRNTKR
jgi:hypothetical protein